MEIHGALQAESLTLGHADEAYRRMYFVRRALATAYEMKQAVDVLQQNEAFKHLKRGWKRSNLEQWQEAVRCFQVNNELIASWRHNVGAKFTEPSAVFALNENANRVTTIEIYRPRTGGLDLNLKLGMAGSLLAAGLSRNKPPDESFEDYMTRAIHVVIGAHAHAIHVARIIAREILLQR